MDSSPQNTLTLGHILKEFDQCADLIHRTFPEIQTDIVYFPAIVDNTLFIKEILEPFSRIQLQEAEQLFTQSQFLQVTDSKAAVIGILEGCVAVSHRDSIYLLNAYKPEARNVQQSETETIIAGPHDAFVESALTNLSLIRSRIKAHI